MFVSHWVADIHQPLHVSFASDRGGNNNKIQWAKENNTAIKCRNLHSLWDKCLLYPLNSMLSAKLLMNNLQSSLTLQWQNTPLITQQKWQQDSIWQWATESLSIARQPALGYCQLKQQQCLPFTSKKITLPSSYHLQFSPVLQQRMLQAAIRLRAILEESL